MPAPEKVRGRQVAKCIILGCDQHHIGTRYGSDVGRRVHVGAPFPIALDDAKPIALDRRDVHGTSDQRDGDAGASELRSVIAADRAGAEDGDRRWDERR